MRHERRTALPEAISQPTAQIGPVNKPLAGQHAVVTGGGRGIGAAIARGLAALGAHLTLIDRHDERLDAQGAALSEDFGISVERHVADVTEDDALAAAFASASSALGDITILVNNAGQAASAPFVKTDLELWQRTLDGNLTGAFRCIHRVLPAMLEAGYGRVVNIASTAGLIPYRYSAAYCAAKHGLLGLTRALALELGHTGITFNAVCPGFTDTDMVSNAIDTIVEKTGRSAAEALAALIAANPQKRLIQPDEVARVVGWLCLPGSSAINGQAIPIAGGEVMS